jgi:deoxyribose-phosphate aldolase
MREYFKKGVKVSGGIKKDNIYQLLEAASGRDDEYIDLDPNKVRIGESSLLEKL